MYKEEDVKLVNDEYAQDLVTASKWNPCHQRVYWNYSLKNRYQQLIKVIKLSMRQAREVMTTYNPTENPLDEGALSTVNRLE